jgi:hypothetical protein
MKSAYIRFLRQLLIFTGILGAITAVLTVLLPAHYISPVMPFVLAFFLGSTLLSFYYLLRTSTERFMKFVNTFLLTILIKLFLYAALMIVYVLFNRQDAVPFMLGFFVVYLCYTVFESVSIIGYTQRPAQGKTD